MERATRQKRKSKQAPVPKDGEVEEFKKRVRALEEAVDSLRGQLLKWKEPEGASDEELARVPLVATNKYVPSTSDGWLLVMMSGSKTSFPSGLGVSITSESGGREYGLVTEGIYSGSKLDVKSGNLVGTFERTDGLEARFSRSSSPKIIDGVNYDYEMTISFSKNGAVQTVGPHPAKTDSNNPVPTGTHEIEIADYPHDLGSSYGAYGTVWFRIGHSGDRYIHPGRVSAGCITCAPKNWVDIYKALNVARLGDGRSVGRLKVAL